MRAFTPYSEYAEAKQYRGRRGFRDQRCNCIEPRGAGFRKRLAEIAGEGIEVQRVHDSVVVGIAVNPALVRFSKMRGQPIEITGVDGAIDVGIAGECVANQHRGAVEVLAL